ncbi:fatty acid synthase-like [Diprion similis]|uniref:fatty acid synthase-like n=1 Tax=Diprion similis TaxID=362088 RepID=UPI001EF7A620|nr:fatty acid synthase-like [Diprion similis]
MSLVAEINENLKELIMSDTLQQGIISCLQVLNGFLQQNCPVVSSMVVPDKVIHCHGAGNIVNAILNIMGLKDLKAISLHRTLSKLGMDSVTAVEVEQTLECNFEVLLTTSDIPDLDFLYNRYSR